jgi:hypothetical protein
MEVHGYGLSRTLTPIPIRFREDKCVTVRVAARSRVLDSGPWEMFTRLRLGVINGTSVGRNHSSEPDAEKNNLDRTALRQKTLPSA